MTFEFSHLLDGLVATLKEEYDQEWNRDEKIRDLMYRWNRYADDFASTRKILELPFSNDEINYLNSRFLDSLYLVEGYRKSKAFIKLCKHGYLPALKWVYERFVLGEHEIDTGLIQASRHGHLDVVKWIREVDPNWGSFHGMVHAIRNACEGGHLEVVQLLAEASTHHNPTFVFYTACEHGHLEIAKWLLSKYPAEIDIFPSFGSYDTDYNADDDPFIIAYVNGHTHILKWLWSLKKF